MDVYKSYLISTVVDDDAARDKFAVYKPYLISTVVDSDRPGGAVAVYKLYLISTVVDTGGLFGFSGFINLI